MTNCVALALVHTDLPPYCRTMSLAPETPLNVADDEAGPGAALETFDSLDPSNGQVLATYPVQGPAEVEAAVQRAREAARWWRAQGFARPARAT